MGKIINKIDDTRESIEDVVADILLKIDKNTTVDMLQKMVITNLMQRGLTSFGVSLNEGQIKIIVDSIVDVGLKTINSSIQRQLRKKNKKWIKRHEKNTNK